jgi:hypothetical protein
MRHQDRDPTLDRFVNLYSRILVEETAVRLIARGNRNFWRAPGLDSSYTGAWRKLASVTRQQQHQSSYAVVDIDLLLIGTVAELVAASELNARDVPISRNDRKLLGDALRAGIVAVHSRLNDHPDTRDDLGKLVGSLGLFEGNSDDQSDFAFAGDTSAQFPHERHPGTGISWDISHAVRIPRFLKALSETAPQTGQKAFTLNETRRVANQFVFRVFDGNWSRPRLANFFDGSDGWFRVSYHGAEFGYPPSRYCDSRPPLSRPCLQTTSLVGWGLWTHQHVGLCRLEASVAHLARETDSTSRRYADQYFTFQLEPFRVPAAGTAARFPILLFAILADNVESLQ